VKNATQLREMNSQRCLRALRSGTPLSRGELGRILGLSRATVGNAIRPLLQKRILIEEEDLAQRLAAGRPGALTRLNPRAAHFVGLDVSTISIESVLIDMTFGVVARESVPLQGNHQDLGSMLDHFSKLPERLLSQAKLRNKDLAGIGISVPGLISTTGRVVSAPLLGWRDFELHAELSQKLRSKWPVKVINDAVAFASVVQAQTVDSDLQDTLLVLLTEGIGSAHIRHGRIDAGAHGFAGEIGHMLMSASVRHAASTSFEVLAGYKRFLPFFSKHESVASGLIRLSQLPNMDKKLRLALEEWTDVLAVALLNLTHLLDPGRIVLGGPLAVLYPGISARISHALRSGLVYGFDVPPISVASLGADSAAIGAAAASRDGLFEVPSA
jgi:predicted NBD/HSP70 family sugar kinase/DNA-binding CsgD family transcriptional regulator